MVSIAIHTHTQKTDVVLSPSWTHEMIKASLSALSIHQLAAQGEVSQVAAHLSRGDSHIKNVNKIVSPVKWTVTKRWFVFCRQFTAQQAGWTGLHPSNVGSSVWRESSDRFSSWEGQIFFFFNLKKLLSRQVCVYILRTKWTHWCLWSFILRVQTPKQLQGSERAPWHWPALEAMWTLLSLSSDMEWTLTLMTGYAVILFMSYTHIQTD